MKRSLNLSLCLAWPLLALACKAENVDPPPPPPPPPPPAQCSEATPICDPGCAAGSACIFATGSCSCQAQCDSSDPTCSGGGPNAGCDTGFFCNTACDCQQEIGCLADSPVCSGSGPNAGCDQGFACSSVCACEPVILPPIDVLGRPSRSTPIDITKDDRLLAMVNSDDGSVSFFNVELGQESRIARIASSQQANSEPMSVVFHPDQKRAFVANRAAGTISRIANADTAQPSRDAELAVGGEPIGLALNPTGTRLWATNWVNGQVHIIDTQTMSIVQSVDVGGNPWAIAITNDGDQEITDEKVMVTQLFGRARGGVQAEGTDDGKEGIVQLISVDNPTQIRELTLAPIASCFTSAGPDLTSGCFPNQLLGITIHNEISGAKAYVTSVAASPRGPVNFNHNVQALVSVIDVAAEVEIPNLTKNLNLLIKDQQIDTDGDDNIGRRFMNVPNAIDFVNRDDVVIGYVSAGGSDIVLRVEYLADGTVNVGSPVAFNIAAGQSPQGLVVKHATVNNGAFVANLISRDVSVLSFRDQVKLSDIASTAVPADSASEEFQTWRGKRFFNTSTGIWAKEGWGSCQACHPLGLTDNVTWQFAAGPRQTIALDGQYASNDPSDMRALNWTAIFDETADFELNTRGVSGGTGAIRNAQGPIASAPPAATFAAILAEDGATAENHQALNGSLRFVTQNSAICSNANTCPDWDQIDAYIQSIRSPSRKTSDATAIAQGEILFLDGGCDKCHGGAKWTVSRTFFAPETFQGQLPTRTFEANRMFTTSMDPGSLSGLPQNVNVDATLIAGDDSDAGTPAFKRQACNIRSVGTFGAAGGADEVRANNTPAQGRNGFNPPSLLALSVGAPYLHNGAAQTLAELLDPQGAFVTHLEAGNPNFVPTTQERAALVAFLLSIDETTTPFGLVAGSVLCP